MKIIERVPSGGPTDSGRGPVKPRTIAIVAVALIVAALVACVLTHGPISLAFFGLAFGASLWTGMIAGAFELDRRRRLNYLRGN
jgi:hypothetical protein